MSHKVYVLYPIVICSSMMFYIIDCILAIDSPKQVDRLVNIVIFLMQDQGSTLKCQIFKHWGETSLFLGSIDIIKDGMFQTLK